MGDSPLRITKSSIQLRFQEVDDLLGAIRARPAGDGPLHLNHQASNSDLVLLQSATSSTQAEVRGDVAALVTTYFGPDYTSPDPCSEREAYADEKLGTFLEILGERVNVFEFIAASVEARISVNDVPMERLHRAAVSALGLEGPLSEGERCFDFEVRVSRAVEPDLFSNLKSRGTSPGPPNWTSVSSSPKAGRTGSTGST